MNDHAVIPTSTAIRPHLIRLERCENCKFSHPVHGDQHPECRRMPPMIQAVPSQRGLMNVTNFPRVQPDQWCGEFRAKIAIQQ